MRFIDAHTHIYMRSAADLESMSKAGVEGVVVCSYFPVKPTGPSTLIDLHRWITEDESKRLGNYGLASWVAVGIHPRSIPSSGVDAVIDNISSFFELKKASALGEVGLETASKEEEDVLVKQIVIVDEYDLPIIFHTPRQNKADIFEKLVKLILREKVDLSKVIIDHLTSELVAKAREIGANVGITVQQGKMTENDAVSIVSSFGPEGIVINSDLSNVPSDPLTLPNVARAMIVGGISKSDVEKVTYSNIKNLLKF